MSEEIRVYEVTVTTSEVMIVRVRDSERMRGETWEEAASTMALEENYVSRTKDADVDEVINLTAVRRDLIGAQS